MILKTGSKGNEVRELQIALGIPDPDGSFGPITEAAVRQWQTKNNIFPNGTIDDTSWVILFPERIQETHSEISDFRIQMLQGHIPGEVIAQIPETAVKFKIVNILRLSHFLSQCSHESAGFRAVYENLNYSVAGLQSKFSKYFPNKDYEKYARNPVMIGSRVYANRNGNGDEASGEGYLYRGRGYIQLTGKSNYQSFAGFVDEDTVTFPDLVATKYPLSSAAFYFSSNRIWPVCDKGSSEAVISSVTKLINGGINGLPERIALFRKYFDLLS